MTGRPPATWGGESLTSENIAQAVIKGKTAIKELLKVEALRKPLEKNTPAIRAQRAAATSNEVKPLADAAFGVEAATRELLNK